MSDLHVLVINLDNLAMTMDCINDLLRQSDMDFDLTVADNASTEPGTESFFNVLESNGIKVIKYNPRYPLNWIWNEFYENNQNKYLCYVNNDVRLACNYTKTIKQVFEKEPEIAIVGHVSNNQNYCVISDDLLYHKLFKKMRQGWDFTIRRECYTLIPKEIRIYFGDDVIYNNVYMKEKAAGMILNSPMIHLLGSSGKSLLGNEYGDDRVHYLKHGYEEGYADWSGLSRGRPEFDVNKFFVYQLKPVITINIVTFERIESLKRLIRQYLNQTNPYFVLDIWQDGPDPAKKAMVESFFDSRIKYNENPTRQNKYGHDMRHKSLMNCKTEWWTTTNDDNSVSPLYVEAVLENIKDFDMVKYSVAMENLPVSDQAAHINNDSLLLVGETSPEAYAPYCKTLDPQVSVCGDVDAASFAVRTEVAQKAEGWHSMAFEGDWHFFEKLKNTGCKINMVNKTLVVHR